MKFRTCPASSSRFFGKFGLCQTFCDAAFPSADKRSTSGPAIEHTPGSGAIAARLPQSGKSGGDHATEKAPGKEPLLPAFQFGQMPEGTRMIGAQTYGPS